MRSHPHPPAWYPDPRDPARVRRWDGRAWTGEVRPLPAWLRTLRLSLGPGAEPPRTSRRLWAVSAGLLVLGGILMIVLARTGNDQPDRVVDRAFLREANSRCARAEKEVVGPNRVEGDGMAEARRVEALASGWERMVADLRRLPVRPADEPAVERWLRSWERWASYGHDYGRALAAGDPSRAREILERSRATKQAITRFASANGLDDCIFR